MPGHREPAGFGDVGVRARGLEATTPPRPFTAARAPPLGRSSGAQFTLLPVVNSLFGASVTTAGLLPGRDIQQALRSCSDVDLALIPGESLNDEGLFIDDM